MNRKNWKKSVGDMDFLSRFVRSPVHDKSDDVR